MSDAERDATPAEPAPAATPKLFDLEFRPDSYLIPDSPVEFAVMRLRGWMRRSRVRQLIAKGETEAADRLRGEPERTLESLPPWEEREVPGMVGEYLPVLWPGEVELLRIVLRVPELLTTSVRARPERGGWELRVVDELELEYSMPRAWYPQPLTLRELIEFVDSASDRQEHPGLVLGTLEMILASERGTPIRRALHILARIQLIESAFYPEIVRWYEVAVKAWCTQKLQPVREAAAVKRAQQRAARKARLNGVGAATPRARPRQRSVSTPAAGPDENDPWVQYQRAMERVLLAGEDMEARARFAGLRAGHKEPGGRAWAGWIFGMIAERAGRFDMAVEFYQRGRVDGTTDVDVDYWLHNNAGYSLVKLGLHAEAEVLCRHATKTVPARYNAWKNLGLALAAQGRVVDAARAYMSAIRACPSEHRAASHLCELFPEHAERLEREIPELVAPIAEWRRWRLQSADPAHNTAERQQDGKATT